MGKKNTTSDKNGQTQNKGEEPNEKQWFKDLHSSGNLKKNDKMQVIIHVEAN